MADRRLTPRGWSSNVTHMATYNLAYAKAHFSEIVRCAIAGEEVVIARDNQPVLQLVPLVGTSEPRKPGSARGQIQYMAQDFDAPLEAFAKYTR